jgi:hypothetical protein
MHADNRDGPSQQSRIGAVGEVLRRFKLHFVTRPVDETVAPTSPTRHRSCGE